MDLDSPSEMIQNLWLISMYRYKEIIILDDFFFVQHNLPDLFLNCAAAHKSSSRIQ